MQRTSRFMAIALAIIAMSFGSILGCGERDSAQKSRTGSPVQRSGHQVSQSASANSPIDQEAIDKAWELFRRTWTQCGETWVAVQTGSNGGFLAAGKYSKQIVEVKGANIVVSSDRRVITEADNLNGLEWIGWLEFKFTAARAFPLRDTNTNELHGPWTSWSPSYGTYRIHLAKLKNGAWTTPGPQTVDYNFFPDPLGGVHQYDPKFGKISCEQIEALH